MDREYNLRAVIDSLPTIKYGVSGPMVRALQTILAKYGWYADRIDGSAGPNTVAGIKLLQTGLGVYVDGIVGPETWSKLLL